MSGLLPPWFVRMVFDRVEVELRQLEDCGNEIEWMLRAEAQRLEQRLHAEAEQMEEDQRQELYELHQDTHWELSELFPRTIRNSMFVTAYAFLEWSLFELCAVLAQVRPHAIHVKDLKGKGIEQARTYITKVQGIAGFPVESVEWQRIKMYAEIRHVIVHRNALVWREPNDRGIRQFVLRNPTFAAVDERGHISIHSEGCRDALHTIRAFLKLVFDRAFDHVNQPRT